MPEPIIFVDSSDVREGKQEELGVLMKELADFVEANESRPIAYGMYLNEAGTRMTVVQIHPDSASMEFHMNAAATVFARFQDLLTLRTMDIYGVPSEAVLQRLRQKIQMLGTATIEVHDLAAGFSRM